MHGRSEAEEPVLSEDVALIICADYRPARVFDSPHSTDAQQPMVDSAQAVTTDTKEIQHDAVHRQEPG